MLLEEQRRDVCLTARRIVESGLVIGPAGDVSVRAGELVVITPAGVALDHLEPGDCPVLSMDGRVLEGQREPSAETSMHLALYRDTDAGAVVHTHPHYGTVVSATTTELPPVHYNALLLGGTVPVVPYTTFGTAELADQVRDALKGKRAALLANHGGVATGGYLSEALEHARLLEWLCGVYVQAKMIGEPRVLSEDELDEAAERARFGWAGPELC